ncbi:hypothetical protein VTJ83DRAFT_6011 [Remersonia thermophila]|uniref:Uncharacterized protein n=1 Tax=Remersonia thermophila TaxID=72144 RepID=A0ABR4D9F6_9PEZI
MKHLFAALVAALLLFTPVLATKKVFAHLLVGNTPEMELSEWENDMRLAKASLIDGFALNIASQDSNNVRSLKRAFQAAEKVGGFKLFFCFDYEAQGPWRADQIVDLLDEYAGRDVYFKHEGTRPMVTTFEGTGSADDWNRIKKVFPDLYFIPDWSSAGPERAVKLGGGVADGLASWGAWPEGKKSISTQLDRAYLAALGGKGYMMPVSPWFYTNLPGWNKNWLWRGDGLWELRWNQVASVDPDYVQILTWNDYGESHYIGPIHEKQLALFEHGRAPINYAKDMPHDAWRKLLPWYISVYKNGRPPARVLQETAVIYYRPSPARACDGGGTVANAASHGQKEMPPEEVLADKVFWSALLNSDKGLSVKVKIGDDEDYARSLTLVPPAGMGRPGVYAGSVPFNGRTGPVQVTVMQGGRTVAVVRGSKNITNHCEKGIQNWDAVVA